MSGRDYPKRRIDFDEDDQYDYSMLDPEYQRDVDEERQLIRDEIDDMWGQLSTDDEPVSGDE